MYNHHLPRRQGTSEPTIHFIFLLLKKILKFFKKTFFIILILKNFKKVFYYFKDFTDDFYFGIWHTMGQHEASQVPKVIHIL